jgi:predicted RND superfamily exporter protein
MRKIIKPVFLASITTFAGFISFCFTSRVLIRDFGYFASFGVLVSFAVAVTLISSLLLIRGPQLPKVFMKDKNIKTENSQAGDLITDSFIKAGLKYIF